MFLYVAFLFQCRHVNAEYLSLHWLFPFYEHGHVYRGIDDLAAILEIAVA